MYQLVTYKKCKMAVKVHTLIYKGADGEGANITHNCYPVKLRSTFYQTPIYYYGSRITPIARIFLLVQRALAPRR